MENPENRPETIITKLPCPILSINGFHWNDRVNVSILSKSTNYDTYDIQRLIPSIFNINDCMRNVLFTYDHLLIRFCCTIVDENEPIEYRGFILYRKIKTSISS
jgi:hypothetical protein